MFGSYRAIITEYIIGISSVITGCFMYFVRSGFINFVLETKAVQCVLHPFFQRSFVIENIQGSPNGSKTQSTPLFSEEINGSEQSVRCSQPLVMNRKQRLIWSTYSQFGHFRKIDAGITLRLKPLCFLSLPTVAAVADHATFPTNSLCSSIVIVVVVVDFKNGCLPRSHEEGGARWAPENVQVYTFF